MYQLLDKRTRESLSRAVSLGDICLNLSFELYNRLQEASPTFRSVTLILIFASRESYVVTLENLDGAQLSLL